MKSGGPLKPKSAKREREDRERENAKAVVRKRARGICEARYAIASMDSDLARCGGPFDFHEVLTRARGGSITDPDNILHVCRVHHDWITTHPQEAAELRLVHNSWEDTCRPRLVPTPTTRMVAVNVRPLPKARPATAGIKEVRGKHPSEDLVSLTFAHPLRPWTLNGERKMTPYARAAKVREWREAFIALGAGSPRMAWAEVEVRVHLRTYVDQDPVGSVSAYKAALDGLVAAGVLDDDDGRYVRRVTFYPPEMGTYDALELVLTGTLA